MGKCILVTGAAGFIGGKVAKALLDENDCVVTIDNFSTGKRENIPSGCSLIEGDVFDPAVFEKLKPYQFDVMIHIAGQSSGEISFDNPLYDFKTNAESTLMLLDYAKKTGCKKFIYASSMSVYGDQKEPFVNESCEPTPKSFYAVGKLTSENYMRIFSEYGIQCTALRFFNVYGIGQNLDNLRQGMASIFLAMAINDHHIVVKGSKNRFRDFVYIDDVVTAVQKAIERTRGNKFEIYNVSVGIGQTVEDVVNTIQCQLPYEISVEYKAGTPGDMFGIIGDNNKIKRDLSWEPKVGFSEGMHRMIQWAQGK